MMATKTKTTAKASSTKAAVPKVAKPVAKAKGTPKVATEAPATGKQSQIAAAERVLAEANEPITCKSMVEAMTTKKLWSSLSG